MEVPASLGRPIALVGLSVLLAATGGCCSGPPAVKFAATPRFVCTGMSTTLTWETSGHTKLSAEPAVADVSNVPADIPNKGERQVAVDKSTTFTLKAERNGKEAVGRQEITFIATAEPHRIQVDAKTCDNGAVVFAADIPAGTWPDVIRVGEVSLSAPLANDLVIEHGPSSAIITAGQTKTAALSNTALVGHWRVVLKTARCEDAPDALVLASPLSCSS